MPFTSPSAIDATDFGCYTGSGWGQPASVVSPFWVSVPALECRQLHAPADGGCEGQVPHSTVCGRHFFSGGANTFLALTVPETSYLCVVICPKFPRPTAGRKHWLYRDSENHRQAHICRTTFKSLAGPPTLIYNYPSPISYSSSFPSASVSRKFVHLQYHTQSQLHIMSKGRVCL